MGSAMNNSIAAADGKMNQKKVLCFITAPFGQISPDAALVANATGRSEDMCGKLQPGRGFTATEPVQALLQEAAFFGSSHIGCFNICQGL